MVFACLVLVRTSKIFYLKSHMPTFAFKPLHRAVPIGSGAPGCENGDGSELATLISMTDFAAYLFATISFFTMLQSIAGGIVVSYSYPALLASTTCGVAAVHYFFIKKELCESNSPEICLGRANRIRYRDWAISLIPMTLELQMLAQLNYTMYDWMNGWGFSLSLFLLAVVGQPAMVVLGTVETGNKCLKGTFILLATVIFLTTAGLTTWRALQPLGNHETSMYQNVISNEAEFKAEMWAVLVLYFLQLVYPFVYMTQEICKNKLACSILYTVLDIATKAGLAFFTVWLYQYNMLHS